jgi:glycyl-tRNA synthetase alpha chain
MSYGDVYLQNEKSSRPTTSSTAMPTSCSPRFNAHEKQAKHLMEQQLALPAYEQVLKAATASTCWTPAAPSA